MRIICWIMGHKYKPYYTEKYRFCYRCKRWQTIEERPND